MSPAPPFCYEGFDLDPERALLTCRYSLGGRDFTEEITFGPGGNWDDPGVAQAARLICLLAGVSYYKTAAPPVIDLGRVPVTAAELGFLRGFYLDGLGEFAYRNDLDLSALQFTGGVIGEPPGGHLGPSAPHAMLIPFGGGIDSIVTVELVRQHTAPALFIVGRPGDRFAAIEAPAAVTGLPIVRAEREIDPQLLGSAELGFRNGHVPVTGIISAIAVMAAALDGRDVVVMSNEWSASIPTLEIGGRAINHQYSKSAAFEAAFRSVLAQADAQLPNPQLPGYFSALRPHSELWVARRFAGLTQYHDTFRSCNRAFHIDPARRLDHWCGQCDKCCFIDLILAPFLAAADLEQIFGGREPLADPDPHGELAGRFRTLLGTSPSSKPFECVGEVSECRAAAVLAAARPDRAGGKLLQALAGELAGLPELTPAADLLRPLSEHFIPDAYAADDLLG